MSKSSGKISITDQINMPTISAFVCENVYEDAELKALLDQDSCQKQEEQYDGKYFE